MLPSLYALTLFPCRESSLLSGPLLLKPRITFLGSSMISQGSLPPPCVGWSDTSKVNHSPTLTAMATSSVARSFLFRQRQDAGRKAPHFSQPMTKPLFHFILTKKCGWLLQLGKEKNMNMESLLPPWCPYGGYTWEQLKMSLCLFY